MKKDERLTLKLPCRIGDTLWSFYNNENGSKVYSMSVKNVTWSDGSDAFVMTDRIPVICWYDIGRTVFISKEKALYEMLKRVCPTVEFGSVVQGNKIVPCVWKIGNYHNNSDEYLGIELLKPITKNNYKEISSIYYSDKEKSFISSEGAGPEMVSVYVKADFFSEFLE